MYSLRDYSQGSMAKRSSSSMAILGLLGIDRWTPYELVQHMKRSTIHYIWPRAESKVYEEPKRLAAAGYVTATADRKNPRRTRYQITPTGRRVLREWLEQPDAAVTFESEGALKILFAEHGTKQQLLTTIHRMRADALAHLDHRAGVLAEVMRDGAPYPDRIHQSVLVFDLVHRLHTAIVEWADFAEQRVRQWPTVAPNRQMRAEAQRLIRDLHDRATATVASATHAADPAGNLRTNASPSRGAAAL